MTTQIIYFEKFWEKFCFSKLGETGRIFQNYNWNSQAEESDKRESV